MTLNEMIEIKKNNGLSNQQIADGTGLPLGTVQKIFSGETTSPRYPTMQALLRYFIGIKLKSGGDAGHTAKAYTGCISESENLCVAEPAPAYQAKRPVHQQLRPKHTMEEYLALPEGTRIEMIDNVFYDMGAPTTIHQTIAGMIHYQLFSYISENNGSCTPFIAPTDVQLSCDDKTMVEPDVLVVCDRSKITKARIVGAPDLIVEILSPGRWFVDTILKMKKYKEAGVREYWVVDPDEKKLAVFHFEENDDPVEYTFDDQVPVGIWNGECKVDFALIYERIRFLYEE